MVLTEPTEVSIEVHLIFEGGHRAGPVFPNHIKELIENR